MDNLFRIPGRVDSTKFFKSLATYFKDATTLFVEGDSIAKEILDLYKKNLQEGPYLPRPGTAFPKSTKLRCKYSIALMNELAMMAENHAEPEICDHLHLYKDANPILEWMDAFGDQIDISKSVPSEIVDKFSASIISDKKRN